MSGENETNQAIEPAAPVEPAVTVPAATPSTPDAARTFSQAEVDRIAGERAKREREKFADYEDLKAAKAKLDEIETAQLSELEQAQKRADEAQAAADKALQTSQERLIRAEFTAAAATAGVAHPRDAYNLADRSGVTLDDAGNVTGVEDAVKALVEQGRLVMLGKPKPPDLNGGAGGGTRPPAGATKLTPEQEAIARKMKISPERYAARLKE